MPKGTGLKNHEKRAILAFQSQYWSVNMVAEELGRYRDVVQRFLRDTSGYGNKKPS